MSSRAAQPHLMGEARQTLVRSIEDEHWWFVTQREIAIRTLLDVCPDGGRVLDVGCGTARVLADVSGGFEKVGVDLRPEAIAIARERVPNGTFVEADAAALPFPDGHFDAVLCLDLISMLPDDIAGLAEIRRVLKDGGELIVHTASYEWLRSGHDAAVGTVRRYTAPRLRAVLKDAGLEPGRITYRLSAVLPVAAASRVLFRNREQTDVGPVNPVLNRLLLAVSRAENRLVRHLRLPFGLSIFAVAEKREGAAAGPRPVPIDAQGR